MEIALTTTPLMTTATTRRTSLRQRLDRAAAWFADRSYDPHRFRTEVADTHKLLLVGGHVVAVSSTEPDDVVERLAR